jgi:hypothetical protein
MMFGSLEAREALQAAAIAKRRAGRAKHEATSLRQELDEIKKQLKKYEELYTLLHNHFVPPKPEEKYTGWRDRGERIWLHDSGAYVEAVIREDSFGRHYWVFLVYPKGAYTSLKPVSPFGQAKGLVEAQKMALDPDYPTV